MALNRFVTEFIISFVMGECKSIQIMNYIKYDGGADGFEISVITDTNEILDFINECPQKWKKDCLAFVEKAKLENSYSTSIDHIRIVSGELSLSALCFNMFADIPEDLVLMRAKAKNSDEGLSQMLDFGIRLFSLASGKEVQSGL